MAIQIINADNFKVGDLVITHQDTFAVRITRLNQASFAGIVEESYPESPYRVGHEQAIWGYHFFRKVSEVDLLMKALDKLEKTL